MFAYFSILATSRALTLGYSRFQFTKNEPLVMPSTTGVKYALLIQLSESDVLAQTGLSPGATYSPPKDGKGESNCYVVSYPADVTNCIITYDYDLTHATIPKGYLLLAFSSKLVVTQFVINAQDTSKISFSTDFTVTADRYHPSGQIIDACGVSYFSLLHKGDNDASFANCVYSDTVTSNSKIFGGTLTAGGTGTSTTGSLTCVAPGYYTLFGSFKDSTLTTQNGLQSEQIFTGDTKIYVVYSPSDVDSVIYVGKSQVVPLQASAVTSTPKRAVIASDQTAVISLMFSPEVDVKLYYGATNTGEPTSISGFVTIQGLCYVLEIKLAGTTAIPAGYTQGIVGTAINSETATPTAKLVGALFGGASTEKYEIIMQSPGTPTKYTTVVNIKYLFTPGCALFLKGDSQITVQTDSNTYTASKTGFEFYVSSSAYTNSLVLTGKQTSPIMFAARSSSFSIIYYSFEPSSAQFFVESSGYVDSQTSFYNEIQVPANTIGGFISTTYSGSVAGEATGGLKGKNDNSIYPLVYGETQITGSASGVTLVSATVEGYTCVAIFTNPSGFKVGGADLKSTYINPGKMTITGTGTLDAAFLKLPESTSVSTVINMDKAHYMIQPPKDLTQKYIFVLASTKGFYYSFVAGNDKVTLNLFTGDGASAGSGTITTTTAYTYPIYGVLTFAEGATPSQLNCVAAEAIPDGATKSKGPLADGYTDILTEHSGDWTAIDENFPAQLSNGAYYLLPKKETTFTVNAQSDVFFVLDKDTKASCILVYPKENSEKLLGYDIFANKIYGVHFSTSSQIRLKSDKPIAVYVFPASDVAGRSVYFLSGKENKLEKPADAKGEIDVYIGFSRKSYAIVTLDEANAANPKTITGATALSVSGLPLSYAFTDLSKFKSISYKLEGTTDGEVSATISSSSSDSFVEYSSKKADAEELKDGGLPGWAIALIVIFIILFIGIDIGLVFLVIWCKKNEKHPDFNVEEEDALEEAGDEEKKDEYEHPDDQNPGAARTNDMANPQASPDEPLNA